MRILDLYCGGGGAGKGYLMEGHDVVGVDNVFQQFVIITCASIT